MPIPHDALPHEQAPRAARVSRASPTELLLQGVKEKLDSESAAAVERALRLAESLDPAGQMSLARAANALLAQQADGDALSSVLLAPLLWSRKLTREHIHSTFGQRISDLAAAVRAPSRSTPKAQPHPSEETQALLESFTSDLRTVLLAVALRVGELEHLREHPEESPPDTAEIAKEALDIFVPLCGRLGLRKLRRKLEDLAFQILEPGPYETLAREAAELWEQEEASLVLLRDRVGRLLAHHHIQARVECRVKGLYSLHRKMLRSGCSLPEVMDKIGVRIIVSSVPECYTVLGLVHNHFRPVPGEFEDYIGLPKENGYQSLHTCVYPLRDLSDKPVELQIRTEQMHAEAEFGVAAHWRYKSQQESTSEGERQLQWLRSLPGQHRESTSHAEFVRQLRRQVFEDRMVVFGAAGRRLRLPDGSTVRDYLHRTGSVHKATSVRVNRQPVSHDHVLKDGDSVELLDSTDPPDSPG